VDCGGEGCDPVTGAYVTSLTRSASVSLCAIYFRPGLSFENARGLEDAQAYALVHEFTHLAGVEVPKVLNKRNGEYERPPEEYHGERDWDHLDLNQRRQMVDAYAAMAWRLGAR
jgi:peptide deformylase